MHNAPAVSFPVGRSRFQGWLLALVAVLGILAALTWFAVAQLAGWRQWLMLLGVVLSALTSAWLWYRTEGAQLAWDGTHWTCSALPGGEPVLLSVIFDAQLAMLVLLSRLDRPGRSWIWLDRSASPTRWLALRRAACQRPRVDADLLSSDASHGALRA